MSEEDRIRKMTIQEAVEEIILKRGVLTIDGRGGGRGDAHVTVSVESKDGRQRFSAERSDYSHYPGRAGERVLITEALLDCYQQAVVYAEERESELALARAW
jgi:hypothetical protein